MSTTHEEHSKFTTTPFQHVRENGKHSWAGGGDGGGTETAWHVWCIFAYGTKFNKPCSSHCRPNQSNASERKMKGTATAFSHDADRRTRKCMAIVARPCESPYSMNEQYNSHTNAHRPEHAEKDKTQMQNANALFRHWTEYGVPKWMHHGTRSAIGMLMGHITAIIHMYYIAIFINSSVGQQIERTVAVEEPCRRKSSWNTIWGRLLLWSKTRTRTYTHTDTQEQQALITCP